MICPACNTRLACLETRQDGEIRRRRYICEGCGENHYTREAFVPKRAAIKPGPRPPKELK